MPEIKNIEEDQQQTFEARLGYTFLFFISTQFIDTLGCKLPIVHNR